MRGVIAPCHTHLKLSLPWRQWQLWITAWQCNSRVSTSLHFHWAISTELCHYPDRQRESTSNRESAGLERNGESGLECWKKTEELTEIGELGGWGAKSVKKKRRSQASADARSEQEELLSVQQQQQQQPRQTYILTYSHTRTHIHTHFPGKDSVLCPQWRMKKHSARVAPLSSYSTQVLTCPISEGKLKEPGRPRTSFILDFVYVCVCVSMNELTALAQIGCLKLWSTFVLMASTYKWWHYFPYSTCSVTKCTGIPVKYLCDVDVNY